MSESIRDAILTAVTVPALPRRQTNPPMRHRRLPGSRCTLWRYGHCSPRHPSSCPPAEQQLLKDWLDRLATARSHATGGLQRAHLDRERVRDQA